MSIADWLRPPRRTPPFGGVNGSVHSAGAETAERPDSAERNESSVHDATGEALDRRATWFEIGIVLVIALIVFGPKRLPELGKSLGSGLREFKASISGDRDDEPPEIENGFEEPPVEVDTAAKPPVETVALWSPRDGIVSPRASCGRPGERDRAVAIRCSHVGFPNAPDCIRTVLKELDAD